MKVKCPKCKHSFEPKTIESMASLGRAAEVAVRQTLWNYQHINEVYVNKTEKYVSIKFSDLHLTPYQIKQVTNHLKRTCPERFLQIANGTATPMAYGMGDYKEPKVMVRFTQA